MKVVIIDQINTGLLLASFLLAYFLPFHLFLFAYAVLGPLHYLTEISWLKKYNFFTKSKYDSFLLLGVGVLLLLSTISQTLYKMFPGEVLLFMAFGMSLAFFMTSSLLVRIGTFLLLGVGAYVFSGYSLFVVVFSMLLPTMIHIYLFTALFMLYGALKNKSMFGFINVVLFFILGGLYFLLPKIEVLAPSVYVTQSYLSTFGSLHQVISNIFGGMFMSAHDIFFTTYGVSIMQCIAFGYTYHYLNWFSKTTVIRWYETALQYRFLISIIWLGSVFFYIYSYSLGFFVLYFLSIVHVLLEFPLNHMTIRGIWNEFKK